MAARLKLIIAYDGAPFAGWQSQRHGNSIQDHLERAVAQVTGTHVRVHGAGRTDAGVHALAQCAHVDIGERRLTTERWLHALNNHLPSAIRVLRCSYAAASFHARYSAKGKIYRYHIWNAAVLPPFQFGRAWHIPQPLEFDLLSGSAHQANGRHDFAAFGANRGKPNGNTVRTIYSVDVRRRGPEVLLQFEGDGFLYKMVRMIVGTAVQVARGRLPAGEIARRLAQPKAAARQRFVAPAGGLVLVRVRY